MDSVTPQPYSLPISALGVPSVALDGGGGSASDVAPCMSVFLPAPGGWATSAVVICPGGGYGFLANDHEGLQVARWFNARGSAAFVLHYQVGPGHHYPTQLCQAQEALSTVRARASEWHINPSRVGIMGFSAGGHLAACAATIGADTPEHRPDFLVLGYPVISMDGTFSHGGSRANLLGQTPDPELVRSVSLQTQVKSTTPPTFIFHTNDDAGVPVENATMFFAALRSAGVAAELHIYAHGPHGVGLCLHDPILGSWSGLLDGWLRMQGIL